MRALFFTTVFVTQLSLQKKKYVSPKANLSLIFTPTPHSDTTHTTLTERNFEVRVLVQNSCKSVEVCRHVKLLIANNCYFLNNIYCDMCFLLFVKPLHLQFLW